MRGVLLGTLVIAAAMLAATLAACAGIGERPGGADPLGTPGQLRADRGDLAGDGVANDSGATVAVELGRPRLDASPQGRAADVPRSSLPDLAATDGFDAGVLYAMAYFPAPSGVESERANSLAELYVDARPGYGLYSFLLGGPLDARAPEDVLAYGELLRVIDTYVMNGGGPAADGGGAGRHGFLLQVDAQRSDGELYERVRPGLSLQMQNALARQLRLYGHTELADRLEGSTGPFLVTSLRPSLIPIDARQPLLVVDLHDLGAEYMYSLVDVYDRPIPGDLLGRPESLSVIARRLQQIFPSRRVDSGAAPAPSGGWIWLVGGAGPSELASGQDDAAARGLRILGPITARAASRGQRSAPAPQVADAPLAHAEGA